MIDTKVEVQGSWFSKGITVKKLARIMNELYNTDILSPNSVGNLAVLRDGEFAGYVDIATEKFVKDEI